ncbi:MAG: hypothetical protein CMI03_00250 [Oceanospirillaceae bacterium]|uniref:class I adenylate cyclase n=1 Tax=unclassified Thalassolituus TaxID=2624967 RepID=UPI000C64918F|nr:MULTISPECIES: class I adenylate cyclase [unclassified Thalassolituus]MAS25670.1 hypothetical protein [Oceanospirillaceae bacterium]MBL35579.1 hypothetical protein [Oceanospirillaceae bacterium]MBS51176.1 hypothetical protein [Oceanospirillaceae bacterium]|tara:strand:+ start:3729 stop:6512 length:2784 start_codon:yes stop_codon:yes gene_type:complete
MTASPSSLISASQIHQWHTAFLQLNAARLEIARGLMVRRQRLVLDALPLLFHLNHPRLPGFINSHVPCGVAHYTASRNAEEALQAIARGIQVPRGFSQQQIAGIYLMGSLGSLAQARCSDLDVWLCYDESLSEPEISELQDKCKRIERWAADMNVELHIFLMNLTRFRSGNSHDADGDDCGSTQHMLLLDEFYRSSLWLAGRQPRWWLTPCEQERRAADWWRTLQDNHRVNADHWLDFGAMPSIPAAEFVGAGLWQLNKGLKDPYKSLLKLLITRHYAGQYPNIRPLCWDLKQQVHDGITDAGSNDAYLLMLTRITRQLESEGNHERVELARRAFYFKARLPLSELSKSQHNSWRAQSMRELCQQWGWSQSYIQELDQRPDWSPHRIAAERNALISEMLSTYRFLAAFSQKYAPRLHISKQDTQTLGNRLYAAFDSRPGKITDINPGITPAMGQEKMALNLKDDIWQLIPGVFYRSDDADSEQRQVLKQSPSLIELLCFARVNGLLENYTRTAIYPTHNPLSKYELKEVVEDILDLQPYRPLSSDFRRNARPRSWHLHINVGVDPQHELSRRGMQKLSNRDDALGYSSARENLILTLDLITINSWGEWQVDRFSGPAAIGQCLQLMLQQLPYAQKEGWPPFQVSCHCASRASTIRLRIDKLLSDVLAHFLEQPKAPYIIEAAEVWYLLENSRDGMQLRIAENPNKLLTLLSRPARSFVNYTLDQSALINSPIRVAFEQAKPGLWQIFYWRREGRLFFYFIDEKGALLHQQWPDQEGSSEYWLRPVLRFLRQVDERWVRKSSREQMRKILLFELKRKAKSIEFELVRRKLPDLPQQNSAIDLRAVFDSENQVTFYCDGAEFSQWQYGDELYSELIRAVIKRRTSNNNYPVFINDIQLPGQQNMIEYLKVKHRLELRLAQALQTSEKGI